MGSHVPNEIMHRANRISRLDVRDTYLLSSSTIKKVEGYLKTLDLVTTHSMVTLKCSIRSQALRDRHPSFDIFHELTQILFLSIMLLYFI